MPLPAQFQLGLELTNIVSPISQAVSALGSLALIDAIKKAGSDFITETKLASLIGRHRIDPVIKFHFRQMVAKSDQSIISRYLDIILESGSGPTVQEALKNPALFSMVIQLSGLAFAHEEESLANHIFEAIEKIVEESGSDLGIVPDYVSLLGTIRACQQQTAAFRWAVLYEAVEHKMNKALAGLEENNEKYSLEKLPDSVRLRSLPIAVLQGLFMWLQSLQSFPEHRYVHLRCDSGISTVVVWCHHILGLSLIVNIRRTEIRFGHAPYNLIVEDCEGQKAGVSLMDPLDPQEPLFTLHEDQASIGTSYEHRAEAYGYGTKLLQRDNLTLHEVEEHVRLIVYHSLEICSASGAYPPRDRVINAARFLFALDQTTYFPDRPGGLERDTDPFKRPRTEFFFFPDRPLDLLPYIVIVFARISKEDLVKCKEMPLSLNVSNTVYGNDEQHINVSESFKILSFLLLGHHMHHEDYVRSAILVSAWGWSVFLDSIDAVDPFDMPVDTLRVLRGVPSRRGLRRTRIIDGPQSFLTPDDILNGVKLVPGVSKTKKGVILVGHKDDAFQVTQQFTCDNTVGVQRYVFGFRQMTELSIWCRRLSPCQCDRVVHEDVTSASEHITSSARKLSEIDKLFESERHQRIGEYLSDSERVFASKDRLRYFIYVSDNPAARWLELQNLYPREALAPQPGTTEPECYIALRGQDTCLDCAIRDSEGFPPNGMFLL